MIASNPQHQPLVSVICLAYNHDRFIREALDSVLKQTYENIEVILVDDASEDKTVEIIKAYQANHKPIQAILHMENLGNCKSFNEAFALSKGKYIIDFATDDVMNPDRIEKQVAFFEGLPQQYGVIYSNTEWIDEQGDLVKIHFKQGDKPPSGKVFKDLLARYIIEPSSMMIKRNVLQELGGYDENLAYEDFDFWIRSSPKYPYAYQDETLTKRRRSPASLSTKFAKKKHRKMLDTTYKVCVKALMFCKTEDEHQALAERVRYEMNYALRMKYGVLVNQYFELLKMISKVGPKDVMIWNLGKLFKK